MTSDDKWLITHDFAYQFGGRSAARPSWQMSSCQTQSCSLWAAMNQLLPGWGSILSGSEPFFRGRSIWSIAPRAQPGRGCSDPLAPPIRGPSSCLHVRFRALEAS